MVKWVFGLLLFTVIQLPAQEIFRLDFEEAKAPEDWVTTNKSEWAHVLGVDGSDYFRFHPFSNRDILESPSISLEAGEYTLYFSWSETGDVNPDFVNVRYRKNNQNWQEVKDFGGLEGGATARAWLNDSAVIGSLDANNYTFQFEYKSVGKFPSQYINLDNIYLVRSDITTNVLNEQSLQLEIYPNPVSERLNVKLNSDLDGQFHLTIYDQTGRIVKQLTDLSKGSHEVDVSHLADGVYLIEMRQGQFVKSGQLIVQNVKQ